MLLIQSSVKVNAMVGYTAAVLAYCLLPLLQCLTGLPQKNFSASTVNLKASPRNSWTKKATIQSLIMQLQQDFQSPAQLPNISAASSADQAIFLDYAAPSSSSTPPNPSTPKSGPAAITNQISHQQKPTYSTLTSIQCSPRVTLSSHLCTTYPLPLHRSVVSKYLNLMYSNHCLKPKHLAVTTSTHSFWSYALVLYSLK